MENFINYIKNTIPLEYLFVIIGILCVILLLTLLQILFRKKKAQRLLEKCDDQYTQLKNIPLAFKLNRANALSRVNEKMQERVEEYQADFDEIQEKLKTASCSLAEIDDLIYGHKTKAALKQLEVIQAEFDELETFINKVNGALDEVLEKESDLREQINALKDEFRTLKKSITDHRAGIAQSSEYLDHEISKIEKMFSTFEEWMFASEFNNAKDQCVEISESITVLKSVVEQLPKLYERAKGVLPRAIDEVGFTYAQAKNKNVYLDHLEVHKNLDFVSEMLKECLNRLRNGVLDNVVVDLDDCEKRIAQLQEQIIKEEKAFDEIKDNISFLFESVHTLNTDLDDIVALYNRVYTRFGFENWTQRLKDVHEKLAVLNDMQRNLELLIRKQDRPYSELLISFKELEQNVSVFNAEATDMKQKLETACSDEERAKKQLVKLQLIINEIRVNMKKHRLPSVSDKFEDDLHRGEVLIKDIRVILDNSPLDVKRLNAEIRTTIDYVYTLYNNVNNLVGMAVMVENAIVFANRYRSTYPDIDSELTRADLCFRNGQYTKALKISLQCIEKLHPGAYEKIISKKDSRLLKGEL